MIGRHLELTSGGSGDTGGYKSLRLWLNMSCIQNVLENLYEGTPEVKLITHCPNIYINRAEGVSVFVTIKI